MFADSEERAKVTTGRVQLLRVRSSWLSGYDMCTSLCKITKLNRLLHNKFS
jgi:hypothetical protein